MRFLCIHFVQIYPKILLSSFVTGITSETSAAKLKRGRAELCWGWLSLKWHLGILLAGWILLVYIILLHVGFKGKMGVNCTNSDPKRCCKCGYFLTWELMGIDKEKKNGKRNQSIKDIRNVQKCNGFNSKSLVLAKLKIDLDSSTQSYAKARKDRNSFDDLPWCFQLNTSGYHVRTP